MQSGAQIQRDTFVQVRDLLTELASQCRTAQRSLASGNSEDSDYVHELALWASTRAGGIADALATLAARGPVKLVERRLQFEPPYERWASGKDTIAALTQLLTLNQSASEAIAALSSQSAALEAEEQLRDIAQQIDAVNRKLSLALVSAQDLHQPPSSGEGPSS